MIIQSLLRPQKSRDHEISYFLENRPISYPSEAFILNFISLFKICIPKTPHFGMTHRYDD